MTKPITPNEVNGPEIPDAVIEVFNELIRRSFDGRHAMFEQETVVKAIMAKLDREIREAEHWREL